MYRYLSLVLLAGSLFAVTGCGKDPQNTGWEYAPQMYHSLPPEPYSQTDYNKNFKDGKNAQEAPVGTVARGQVDYYYPHPNTNEGYEASRTFKNPVAVSPVALEEGKQLFLKYCQHCHGTKGDGNGAIPAAEKFPQPPSYWIERLLEMPDGQMFHSITHGKGVMGSHASQLQPAERWKVIHYIRQLQKEGLGQSGVSTSAGDADGTPPANNPNNANLPVKPASMQAR
jgi:mono/diheme cytochrome c family protein